jgi:TP901 family phage tail tape measure protein
MASNLDLSATLKLIDDISGPLRGIESQVSRSVDAFNDARSAVKKLEATQNRITAFQDMGRQLTETSGKLDTARQRMNALRQQIESTDNPSQTLINRFNAASRSVDRLGRNVNDQTQTLAQLRRRLESAGVSTSDLGRHQSRLADQIAEANRRLDQQRERMDRVRRAQQQSQQMGDMRNKAMGLAAGGAAATYGAAMFLGPGLEFEAEMSRLQALTRLDKTSPQLKALKEQAEMLGASTNFTQADAARGQAFLAMAGFTPNSIKAAMPGMLDLALAGGMELPQVADIASNILTGMDLDPTKMTNVADVLSAAFTRANLDVGMLGETMKYAAPGAALLGVSIEDTAAMAGKLADAGIQASMGGTSLKSIMSRLAGPPAMARKALAKLNVETKDANGNLRKMPDILKELDEKTKNMGNADKLSLFKAIAGEEASGALAILIKQAGNGELQKLSQTLSGANGEAAKLAETMNDNRMGEFKETMSGLDALRSTLYEANADSISSLLTSITAITGKMTEWAKANPELVATLGKMFGILAIGAIVFGSFGAILLTILGPMALLRASFATLGGLSGILGTLMGPLKMLWSLFGFVGQAVVSAVALIGKSLMFMLSIVKTVGAAMMANPILIAITLLAVAAYLIYKNWGPIKEFFIALWSTITASVSAAWEWIKSIFSTGIQALNTFLSNFNPVSLFMSAFAAVWSYLSGLGATFYTYGANMLDGLKNGIMSKASAVVEGIKGVAGRVKGAFTGLLGIRSPSRVFTDYGDYMMQGLNNGLLANNSPVDAMLKTSNSLRAAMDTSEIRFDNRKPIMASAMMGGVTGQSQPTIVNHFTINAQPGQSEQQIAQLVAQEVAKTQRGQSNNTALYDIAEDW